ncbi:MAG: methanol dehydrogenase [Alphaproteobacteria bacterium]|nr:methanol dehydrogenase [Alphaproteobacteria bacterium]
MSYARLFLLLLALVGAPAAAQDFPKLDGHRVVDAANLLPPQDEAALTQKLEALEKASSRQLVVATIPDLHGDSIEDYGYKLGRAWGIGQKGANNGTILIVAPNDRKVRIEVGYGLEPILTDALSSVIISTQILPRFKQNDYVGGINAGTDAIIEQLQAPPEQAEKRVLEAKAQQATASSHRSGNGSFFPFFFWIIVMVFILIPFLRARHGGKRFGRSGLPVVIWGPGLGGWGGGSGGSSWGSGGGGWGGGGGGGFSGGGGSFGGGGASGGW